VAAIDALDDATVNEYIPVSVSDSAKAATLLASDRARMMTGMVVNSTAGVALD
jgi:hypothetical protein